eukprot:m.96872 g.96872  ORF g.96872 m.96872 type:complete len:770 (+) comp26934_c2_seq1:144-2453(+)
MEFENQSDAEVLAEWQLLQASAPPHPKGKPSTEQLVLLKSYKTKLKTFTSRFPQNQLQALGITKTGPTSSKTSLDLKVMNSTVHSDLKLSSKNEQIVFLGKGGATIQFSGVLPFYSPTTRTRAEKAIDSQLGINRRVFCNLFVDKSPLKLTNLDASSLPILRHAFLLEAEAKCSESFFQAAKCAHECDARFIIHALNAYDAAAYGQGRMVFDSDTMKNAITFGIDPSGFTVDGDIWRRIPERRADWDDIKISVMIMVLRSKFLTNSQCSIQDNNCLTEAQDTCQALIRSNELLFPIEHTAVDKQWGDGADGNGLNLLGRCLAQVIYCEGKGGTPLSLPLSPATVKGLFQVQNSTFVNYSWPEQSTTPMVDYLCILDFEATCDANTTPSPQEIIEFPTLLVSTATRKIVSEFHEYVRPDVHQTLSKFCTDLTGITQDMVDNGKPLKEVLKNHRDWLLANGLNPDNHLEQGKKFIYVTCGDWDLRTCLPKQLKTFNMKPAGAFRDWLNIKTEFANVIGATARGMTTMLAHLNLNLVGRHHSGIDDCRNINRIAEIMLKKNWRPRSKKTEALDSETSKQVYYHSSCRKLNKVNLERAIANNLGECVDRSFGCVVVTTEPHALKKQVLMIKPRGKQSWAFPKGHANERDGKSDEQAAIRETKEETGVLVSSLDSAVSVEVGYSYIGRLHKDKWEVHPNYPNDKQRPTLVTHKLVRYYLAFATADGASMKVDHTDETDEVAWVNVEDVPRRLSFDEERTTFSTLFAHVLNGERT